MQKEPLRTDKTCLNCNHLVEERFCPNCGQENTETRKTFYQLYFHVFEVLIHYDSKFWTTITILLFRPAALTKAYISGRRLSFLNPAKLFIFISFITFLLISLFPHKTVEIPEEKNISQASVPVPTLDSLNIEEKSIDGLTKIGIISEESSDTIKKILNDPTEINPEGITGLGYKNINELDSLQKEDSENAKVNSVKYWFLKKWLTVKEENTNEEIVEKFSESFTHNLHKVLLIYLPVFAFILWLFHDKKRWYYFDHGIFTLHYFSFLLLLILMLFFVDKFKPLLGISPILGWVHFSLKVIGILWMICYFFPAHSRFYGDHLFLSFFKSTLVFVINLIVISVLMVLYGSFTYLNLH